MFDQVDSPAFLLAQLSSIGDRSPKLIFLSGPSGAGKSSWCLQLAGQARASGLVVGGLISPPVFSNGLKIGIDLVDQVTGECRNLAVRRNRATNGIGTANWLFDPNVLAWGNRQLLELPPCDILFLDELGPLELVQERGLQEGLNLMDNQQVPLIVAVIRPQLLSIASQRWPWGETLALNSDRTLAGGM